MYAIFVSVKQLDHLLRDNKFVLQTDHKNLFYITDSSNHMIVRWYMAIQELDFTKEFTIGKNNPIADNMSRLCPNLMKDEPSQYDDMNKFFLLCLNLDSDEYIILSKVSNSIVEHHGVERTIRKILVTKI